MTQKIKTFGNFLLDTVLPPRCAISGDPVDVQGMIAPHVWQGFDFIADPICDQCGIPFAFDSADSADRLVCTSCLNYPPDFHKARAAVIYNDSSRDMVLGFKHGDQTHLVRSFIPWLRQAAGEMLQDADVMIPVPLHRWRLLKRRYNQAALIAQRLSDKTGIRCLTDSLIRTRSTPVQGYMKFEERRKNVKRAFAVREGDRGAVQHKNIILIDDVYTTGATANECVRVLKKAGAARVDVLTLARVLKDDAAF